MATIEIKDKVLQRLQEIATENNVDINVLCNAVLSDYTKTYKEEVKKTELTSAWVKSQYCDIYTRKYGLQPYDLKEAIDSKNIQSVIGDLQKSFGAKTQEVICKMLIWYVCIHKNTDQNGSMIVIKCNTLFQQAWLLRNALQYTNDKSIHTLEQVAFSGKDINTLLSSEKRGDSAGEHENLLELSENLYIRLEKLIRKYPKYAQFADEADFKLLYRSATPDAMYLRKAEKLINIMEKELS